MTVKDIVLDAMHKFYTDENHSEPPEEIMSAYMIGACLADEIYHIGYRKGLSDAQIGGVSQIQNDMERSVEKR